MKTIFNGKRFSIVDDNGWNYMKHPGGSAMLPILNPGKINESVVLVKQHRPPANGELIEIPAGTMDVENETPQQCAERELTEETGYVAGKVESLGYFYVSPGVSAEKIYIFIGTELTLASKKEDIDERTEVIILPIDEAIAKIGTEIIDAKTIISLLRWKQRSRKLPGELDTDYPFWNSKDGKEHCNEEEALSLMLKADFLFVGSTNTGPFFADEEDEGGTEITVNCSDLFDWGTADAERLPYNQIGPLYKSILKTGSAIEWCCLRRGMRPQGPVEKQMRERGTWTEALEALPPRKKNV